MGWQIGFHGAQEDLVEQIFRTVGLRDRKAESPGGLCQGFEAGLNQLPQIQPEGVPECLGHGEAKEWRRAVHPPIPPHEDGSCKQLFEQMAEQLLGDVDGLQVSGLQGVPFQHGKLRIVDGGGRFAVAEGLADLKDAAGSPRDEPFHHHLGGGNEKIFPAPAVARPVAGLKHLQSALRDQGRSEQCRIDFQITPVPEELPDQLDNPCSGAQNLKIEGAHEAQERRLDRLPMGVEVTIFL